MSAPFDPKETEIIQSLLELESGAVTREQLCSKHGISDSTLNEWQSRYPGLKRSMAPFQAGPGFHKLDRYLIIALLCALFGGLLFREYFDLAMDAVVSGGLGVLVGAIILLWVFGDARRGRTGYDRLEVRRGQHPILFWILISTWTLGGVALTLASALYALRN